MDNSDIGNTGYTRHGTKINVRENRRENPEILATLGTQDTVRKQKGQSRMDNSETLVTLGTQDEDKQNINTQHNMCWTPLYANKHK
jgi:hypothetical protein